MNLNLRLSILRPRETAFKNKQKE